MCTNCGHTPHLNRNCRYIKVSGPPSTKGRKVGDGYEHVGRTVTPCPCTDYQPTINGKEAA